MVGQPLVSTPHKDKDKRTIGITIFSKSLRFMRLLLLATKVCFIDFIITLKATPKIGANCQSPNDATRVHNIPMYGAIEAMLSRFFKCLASFVMESYTACDSFPYLGVYSIEMRNFLDIIFKRLKKLLHPKEGN